MPRIFSSRTRWIIPPAIAAATAAAVVLPQAASGAVHPNLPTRSAAQVLADLRGSSVPEFSGTVVATSNLGLPSLPGSSTAGSSGAELQQVETLLTGSHTIKIAYGGESRQRVAVILSDLSESDVVHNGNDLWTYSSQDNAVTHTTLPAESAHRDATPKAPTGLGVTPEAAAQQALSAISPSTTVTIDKTAMVAGRPAYQLVLRPKDASSLIGSVRIALDSVTHAPLRVQAFAASDASTPALQVGFTDVSFATPAASVFRFTAPAGSTVTEQALPAAEGRPQAAVPATDAAAPTVLGKGWTSVAELTVGTGAAGQDSSGTLDALTTRVPEGRVLTTKLVSALLTDDGRLLVGAVTPQVLQGLSR